MADYNANIKVNADTRQAERSISQLEQALKRLSSVKTDIGGGLQTRIQDIQNEAASLGRSFQRLGGLIKNAAYAGGFTALSATVLDLTAKVSNLGSLIPGIGSKFAQQAAAATTSLGVVEQLLNRLSEAVAAVGGPGNAAGIAAITTALVAFGPQIARAAVDTEKLGAALGEFASKGQNSINPIADAVTKLNTNVKATASSFEQLIAGSTLNQLNAQLRDAVEQSGAFHSSTVEAVTAAEQLVAVIRTQAEEQRAINDLVRKAKGITQTELQEAKAIKSLETKRKAQEYYNLEIDEYNRLAQEAAVVTKQWEQSLKAVNTAAKAGVLGSSSQIRARLQEMRENRRSADIARERSAALMGQEQRMRGAAYPLSQVPARGELFPGGRTETAARQYRDMLNVQAFAQQAIEKTGKSRLQTEAAIFRTTKQISNAQAEQNKLDENSVQIIREQNALLLEQYRLRQRKPIAAMTPQERAVGGILDPASLRADRERRVTQGRAAQKRTRQVAENVAIGGAFPLLFGGGPGAVLGGAAGGLIPGSPMLSVATSAIGGIIDAFVSKIAELGVALNNVGSTFDTLKERALISNREREKELELLQNAGFAATANAVAQQELYKIIGVSGVENLRELGSETDKLNRTWAELGVQIQAVVAGPLTDLARVLNDLLAPKAMAGRVEALRADLAPAQRAGLNKELLALGGPGSARYGAQTKGLNVVEIELAARKFPEKVQAILDKYGPMRVNAEIKYDPVQVREQTVSILQKQLEVLDITKKFSEAAAAQRESDRQRYDLIKGYEESIAAIRRRIEDEITNKRLTLIQKENELLDIQASIRQESLAIGNMQAQATAGAGLPTAARDVARQAAEAVSSFQEKELSLAEQAAKLKRDAALDALRTDIEAAKFQADTAREVSKLNVETAKKVAQFNESVRKQNQQQDTRRFEIEKQLAEIRLNVLKQELDLIKKRSFETNQPGVFNLAVESLQDILKQQEALKNIKPPAPIQTAGGPALQGVSLAGINSLNQQLQITQERINAAKLALNDLLALKNQQEFTTKMQNIAENIDAPLKQFTERLVEEEATRTRYIELVSQGVKGVVAERIVEIESMRDLALLQYDAVIATLEQKKAQEGITDALKAQIQAEIDLQKARRGEVAGKAASATGQVQLQDKGKTLQEYITRTQEELNDLESRAVRVADSITNAIGNSMAQGLTGLVEGTQEAQEVFANFLKSVGDILIQEGTRMIAMYIAIGIAKAFAGLAAGSSSSADAIPSTGNPAAPTVNGFDTGMNAALAAEGAYWQGGFQAFANGGMVDRPTLGLVGEGGEPEYIIPASKMRSAMNRYAAGARGSSVIPGSGEQAAAGTGGGTAVAAPIDVRYTVERINSVDYVTADQFRSGMQQAAEQGARRGEQRTIANLRQNTTTRRKLGL